MTKTEITIAEDAAGYTVSVVVSETADATDGERDIARLFAAAADDLAKRTKTYMEDKQCKH